ncbi:MAG: acetate--CoA ligase [Lentisphaeria bacterium]|nr:acetate--CoA ligase [Lentisphaeria bacterium]
MSKFIFNTPEEIASKAHVSSMEQYKEIYAKSYDDTDVFWSDIAKETIDWFEDFHTVREYDYTEGKVEWYLGGKTNVSHNCIDRHLEKRGDQTAIIWEGNDPSESQEITYKQLHAEVCRFANVLKNNGVKKGDRVTLYMPMIPELAYAMLACARIGAVHSIVFGGFSAEALNGRIQDCASAVIITTDELLRGSKVVPMKATVDTAVTELDVVETVIVYKRTGADVEWTDGRDKWWHEEMEKADADCAAEALDSEDPLFILYTSGSTGKPKGILHTTAGYNVYTAYTHKMVFDYHDGDIYWCTADIGWVTGHSYIVYGPLTNGATTLMFESIPTFPDAGRFWDVVDRWKVNIFYTAPTAIRALAAQGPEWPAKYDLSSLRVLGTVGEPINPEAWMWYWENIGHKNCPIVDTWWQTETGGIMITPQIGAVPQKPGSATLPFYGIKPVILEPTTGEELEGACNGILAIKESWPGQMRGVYGDPKRFKDTYFIQYF